MLRGRQSRRTSRLPQRTGFTLLELVVAMAIFSIVLVSTMLALNMTFTVGLRNRRRSEAQEDLSAAMEQITRELRQTDVAHLISPAPSSLNTIDSPGDGGFVLEFTRTLASAGSDEYTVSYGTDDTPDDPAETVAPVGSHPTYQVTTLWNKVGEINPTQSPQALTGQNVTSFTAERPSWSNNVIIITMQSEQLDATGSNVSPLTVMSMVTLRQ